MELDLDDIQNFERAASYVRLSNGGTFTESLRYVKLAHHRYGIPPKQIIQDRLYKLPLSRLKQVDAHNRHVSIMSQQRNVSYAKAFSIMDEIRIKYGITFREFSEKKFYSYKTDDGLQRAVRRYIENEGRFIQKVCRETGWTVDEAEDRMRRATSKWPVLNFRKYANYGMFAMTDEEIDAKIREWNRKASEYRKHVMDATGWTEPEVRAHMTRINVLYDIIPAYYMCYRAWELTEEQIDGYARQKLSERISRKYNDSSSTAIIGNKDEFDDVFRNFTKRKFWVNRRGSSVDEFIDFASGVNHAFCKPLSSGGGLGTFKVDLNVGSNELRQIYENFMSKSLVLVEESVQQHDEINEFYSGSVNTIRVVTIQDEDGTRIISSGIRFGLNSITDNFSADGMVADIDVETGRIVTPAVDKKGMSYESHPSSGKRFVGFHVPHWDQVVDMAKRAMDVLPGLNYVGWDLAVSPDHVSLIEGNSQADLVLVQAPYAPDKVGKRYLFDRYLKQ